MIELIRQRRLLEPFTPFLIRTGQGTEYVVPTPKHVSVNPKRTYVVVFFEDDTHATIPGRRIVEVVDQPNP